MSDEIELANNFEVWQPPQVSKEHNDKQLFSQYGPEIDKIRQVAIAEGEQQGYEIAKAELKNQINAELAQERNVLNRVINNLAQPMLDVDQEIEQQLVNIIKKVANKLVRQNISVDDSWLIDLVKDSISLLPFATKQIKILVSEQDLDLIKSSISEVDDKLVEICVDDSFQPGDCKVISETSQVDATLESRMNTIIEQAFHNEDP